MHSQLLIVLLITFVSSTNSQCSKFVENTRNYNNCWILFRKFRESFVEQHNNNLYKLNQIFFPTSRIPPQIVKVNYSIQLVMEYECDLSFWRNQTRAFGWTSKSLYNNFDGDSINQIPLQVPYLVLHLLECKSGLENQPYVDNFLWAGGQRKLPEVNLTLDVYMLSLNVSLYAYEEFTNFSWTYWPMHECPSNETINCALVELNQWVSFVIITFAKWTVTVKNNYYIL